MKTLTTSDWDSRPDDGRRRPSCHFLKTSVFWPLFLQIWILQIWTPKLDLLPLNPCSRPSHGSCIIMGLYVVIWSLPPCGAGLELWINTEPFLIKHREALCGKPCILMSVWRFYCPFLLNLLDNCNKKQKN